MSPAEEMGSAQPSSRSEQVAAPVALVLEPPKHGGRRWSPRWGAGAPLILVGVLIAVFFVWPIIDIAVRSFNVGGLLRYSSPHLTLSNYADLLHSAFLRAVSRNTVEISVIATLVTLVLAFPAAYLMSRLRQRLSTALFVLILLPFFVSILVRLFSFTVLLSTDGIVNSMLRHFGLGPYSLLYNTTSTVIGMVDYLLPFMILILFSAMAAIDPQLTLAAKSSGANGWQAFRTVYLPLVRNTVVGGALLIFVIGLSFFQTPAILGSPHNATVSVYVAQEIGIYEWGDASAFGMVLLVLTVISLAISMRLTGSTALFGGRQLGGGKGVSRAEKLKPGALSILLWVDVAICLAVLLAPLLVIIPVSFETSDYVTWPAHGFTLAWYRTALTSPQWAHAIDKSILVGSLVAAVSVALGFMAARAIGRITSAAVRSVLLALIYAPIVVPAILLAIGTFDTQTALGSIDSVWGLVAVHSTMALPFTFTVLTGSLAGLDPAMEKAAWSLGASQVRALRSVVVPAIVPALVGGALLAFVTSWDEAVVALFQTNANPTIPVLFFSEIKGGVQPTVAAVGCTLMLLVLVVGAIYFGVSTYSRRRRLRSAPAQEISSAASAVQDQAGDYVRV